jgi:hypothetical protein
MPFEQQLERFNFASAEESKGCGCGHGSSCCGKGDC